MADRWLTDYETCARLGQEIMEKITGRSRHPKGSSSYMKDSSAIRTMMRQFSAQLNALRQDLVSSNLRYSMTHRELERRQNQLDQLSTKEKQLEQAMRDERMDNFGARSDLLDFGPTTSISNDPWGVADTSNDGATADPTDLSFDQVRTQQQVAMRQQDEGLEALSDIINRQKHMALDIGNEVDVQNELIDDITDHVDRTDQRLLRETRHIKLVDRKSNTCAYWVVAVLLFITILVIAFVPYGGKI